jgi:uncharacterized membrane protein
MIQSNGLLFALFAALLWGANGVILKVGLSGVNRFAGTYVTIGISTILLFFLSFLTSDFYLLYESDLKSILFLSLAGISQYVLGRTFAYSSIQTIGSSRAYPITSTRILFSSLLGVILLGEKMGWFLGLGTILIFFGIFILTSEGSINLKGLHYAIGGAIFWGISPIFVKFGLLSDVILSNFISILSAFAVYSGIIYSKRSGWHIERRSVLFIMLSSITSFSAVLSYYYALSLSPVVIVVPISNLYPLFTVILSFLFIQRLEQVTFKVLIGCLVVILGTYLVLIV